MALSSYGRGGGLADPFETDFFGPFFRYPLSTGLGETTTGGALTSTPSIGRAMAVDVTESDKGYTVRADIPGMNKEDINVSVDGDVLRISAQKGETKEEDKDEAGLRYHRQERSSYYTGRALRMPRGADLDNVKASYNNGVLRLDVAKKPQVTGKTINVA